MAKIQPPHPQNNNNNHKTTEKNPNKTQPQTKPNFYVKEYHKSAGQVLHLWHKIPTEIKLHWDLTVTISQVLHVPIFKTV